VLTQPRKSPADDPLELLSLARREIATGLRSPPPRERSRGPVHVNVTILLRGALRASTSGRAPTLREATADGARRAAHDARFGPMLSIAELDDATVELWVQRSRLPLSPRAALESLDLGADGVDLECDGARAYYKPSVPLTLGVTSRELLLRRLSRKARLAPDAWARPGARLHRTTWDMYLEHSGLPEGVVRLHRLRPLGDAPATRDELLDRLDLATDRLVTSQRASGLFLYRYHPFTGRVARDNARLVRQAGCAYAVAAAAEAETDPVWHEELRASARDAVAALRAFESRTHAGTLCFERDGPEPAPLGAVALVLLALQFAGLRGELGPLAGELVRTILGAQAADGCFRCDLQRPGAQPGSPGQNFYPGEALLALTYEAERGDAACAEAIARALPWYRRHFRRAPSPAFVLWQVDAWRRAEALAGAGAVDLDAGELRRFVFELVDWILPFQQGAPSDFAGGFAVNGRPPGFSTSLYAEAAIRAFELARRHGDEPRSERYRKAALRGLSFLMRLQIVEEMTPLFRAPELALGATTSSLDDFTIRCDFDQHTITAFLAACEADSLLPD